MRNSVDQQSRNRFTVSEDLSRDGKRKKIEVRLEGALLRFSHDYDGGNCIRLNKIGVPDNARGKGVARGLVGFLFKYCLDNDIDEITGIISSSAGISGIEMASEIPCNEVVEFYESLGFTVFVQSDGPEFFIKDLSEKVDPQTGELLSIEEADSHSEKLASQSSRRLLKQVV